MGAFAKSWALVIGIDAYQNGIPPLSSAVNDAEAVAHLLNEQGYEVILLRDANADKSGLERWLQSELPAQMRPDHRLLVYYAGHGVALNGESGPTGYLLPQDANPNAPQSMLSMTALHQALNSLPCRHLLLILDCCFAGAFKWSTTRDAIMRPSTIYQERFERFISSPAWQVITSTSYDQRAIDTVLGGDISLGSRGDANDRRHSPFAQYLIEAIANGQADLSINRREGDKIITATELYFYLRDAIEMETAGRGNRQTPGLWPLQKQDKCEYVFLLVPEDSLRLDPAPMTNPYKGLQTFENVDQEVFFGRERVIRDLQVRVCGNRGSTVVTDPQPLSPSPDPLAKPDPDDLGQPFTAVIGASGIGKSSLVKAGLLPRIPTGSWEVVDPLRPGSTPLAVLQGLPLPNPDRPLPERIAVWRSSNGNEGKRLLLVVDQFEELITLCRNAGERARFQQELADSLAQHGSFLRLLVTVRADFEPQFTTGDAPLARYWTASPEVGGRGSGIGLSDPLPTSNPPTPNPQPPVHRASAYPG